MARNILLLLVPALLLLFYLATVDLRFVVTGEYASSAHQASCVKPEKMHGLSITTITKNSGPYIREWLEYHLLVGVEHFFILDNQSPDQLRDVLEPYVQRKLVTYIPWPDTFYRDLLGEMSVNTQQKGIAHALSAHGCKSDWTALIDDDEFLVPKDNLTLSQILEDYTSYGGLAVGWAWFGSNGHVEKPASLVVEAYTRRRGSLDHLYKTIVQPKHFLRMKTIHEPKLKQPLVTEGYQPLSTRWKHPTTPTNQRIQLNHYKSKSLQEWLERSEVRGAVAGPKWRDKRNDFYLIDYNEMEDRHILSYLPGLKQRLGIS